MRRRWMYIRPEYMDLRGGCAKETAEYIDGILFFEKGYHRDGRGI